MAKKNLIRVRVQAFKDTLQGITPKEKGGSVSISIAKEFNSMLEEIKPEIKSEAISHLPHPITWEHAPFAGVADIKFIELEMKLNETLAVLDELEAHH